MTRTARTRFHAPLFAASLAVGSSGCSILGAAGSLFGGSGDTGGSSDPEAVEPADAPEGTCTSELEEDELEQQMALFVAIRETVQDFGSSATAEREARRRLETLPRDLFLSPQRVQAPAGLEWLGAGLYAADTDLVTFGVVPRWSGGPEDGEAISHDLFDASNYFTELRVLTDASAGSVTVLFEDTGPLVGLLGLGNLVSGDSVPLSSLQRPVSGVTLAFEASLDANLDGVTVAGSLNGSPVAPGGVREDTTLRTLRGRNGNVSQRVADGSLLLSEASEDVVVTATLDVQGETLSYTGELEVTEGVLTKAESRCPRD